MKIDKDVVLPPKGASTNKGRKTSIFHQMEVGDSVFFPNRNGIKPNKLSASKATVARHITSHKFAARIVEGGVRIWRVA